MIELYKLDSDVLVGHNISGFDLDVLLHRAEVGIFYIFNKIFSGLKILFRPFSSNCYAGFGEPTIFIFYNLLVNIKCLHFTF